MPPAVVRWAATCVEIPPVKVYGRSWAKPLRNVQEVLALRSRLFVKSTSTRRRAENLHVTGAGSLWESPYALYPNASRQKTMDKHRRRIQRDASERWGADRQAATDRVSRR